MRVRLGLALLAVVLAGCAATTTIEPADNSDLSDRALVNGQMDRDASYASWRSYSLVLVDDQPVRRGFMSSPHDSSASLPEGPHRFVVEASFNTGFGSGGPWGAIVPLRATVKAGQTYRINGIVRDNLFVVWLEDVATGAKVSEESSAAYARNAVNRGMVPIVVPHR